jgi:D-beta-D-heptose 7-phosphate kinase/D-beta-D-heptose 1-phosphate adenosyltransferase
MTTVFVNGTFDILHLGHIGLLEYAKSLGDELIVGIDSDARVKLLKGENRPINTERERSQMLLAIKYVNKVFVFDTDAELTYLVGSCDIMVKGSDYIDQNIIGS